MTGVAHGPVPVALLFAFPTALTHPYFDSHPGIKTAWLVVALVTVVIELSGVARRRPEATRADRGSQIVLRLTTAPGAVLLVFGPTIVPGATIHPPLATAIVGLALFAAGEAMRVWAKVALGRYFTYTVQTSADQPVITSGPYRFVRHPSYSGLLLMALGLGALWDNWLSLAAITVGVFAGLAYRISVEEKALLRELGDRYAAFAADRKRLIPFVW
jgi:protein-S-isoprenylcysteine O-methyltransferase Ste14